MDKLTPLQISYLRAAKECDSVTSENLRLQTLFLLEKRGLLEAFDSDVVWNGRNRRQIVFFMLTEAGKAALEAHNC